MKSPLATVKDTFGDKAKLVAELEKFTKNEDLWVSRLNENKGLAHVSNAKLVKLHATFTAVKEKFGTRAKMIDAICELEKRAKDEGFKSRLSAYPVPRLWDMYKASEKRSKPATKKTAAPKKAAAAPKKVAAPKKAAKPAAKKKKK
ncbi:hypothetical protein AKJ09_02757 [Labilithrix luteola]|uniref:Uncharacterized protein n=1 Tax=Labilithrix luteola TaxID=1391654 RepID=A0A0K1PRD3_9BACT|nr:hypothetical protein [Labilithrix luteola]AKU96093.1 hypothetical protein AKJ09_02757 [Labilithrix luteola]